MGKKILRKRKRKGLSEYTVRGCPCTKNYSQWCYSLCEPVNGKGFCGRIAPHALTSRIQEGIRKHNEIKDSSP